jgi:prenyltransferase beta subunit
VRRSVLACLTVLLCLALARGQSPEQKKTTIEYLRNLQVKGGGFVPAADNRTQSLRATSSALRALKYFGGEARDRAACVQFVKACFDRNSGGFTDRPGKGTPEVVTTAVGIMAVVELKLPVEDYAAPVIQYLGKHSMNFEDVRIAAAGLEAIGKLPPAPDEWLGLLKRLRNEDGTFGKGDGKARDTGGAAVAVLRLGGKVDREAVLKALKAGQREDGGFGKDGAKGSDLETTYRVMRGFHMLKDVPDVKKVRSFIASCRNDDGGYGVVPGQKSSASGTYFAAIILHWLDEK